MRMLVPQCHHVVPAVRVASTFTGPMPICRSSRLLFVEPCCRICFSFCRKLFPLLGVLHPIFTHPAPLSFRAPLTLQNEPLTLSAMAMAPRASAIPRSGGASCATTRLGTRSPFLVANRRGEWISLPSSVPHGVIAFRTTRCIARTGMEVLLGRNPSQATFPTRARNFALTRDGLRCSAFSTTAPNYGRVTSGAFPDRLTVHLSSPSDLSTTNSVTNLDTKFALRLG